MSSNYNNFFSLLGATIAIISCSSSIIFVEGQNCPPAWNPSPEAFGESDYVTSRQICTDACNADGYCCTLGNGGCAKVPCTTGCHLAFFSSTLQECYDQCDAANAEGDCYYTHERHPDIASLGFNPIWASTGGQHAVATCGGPTQCGCIADFGEGGKSECSADACRAGCLLAQQQALPETPQDEKMYRGSNVPKDPRLGKDPLALMDSLTALNDHVTGGTQLSWTEINDARVAVEDNGAMIPTTIDLINAALLLIENYDALVGPLFLDVDQFPRTSTTQDGNELRRAIRSVQQAALEGIYGGTQPELINKQDHLYDPIVESCTDVLANRPWGSHTKFPGALLGPQGSEADYTVSIDTTYNLPWGKKVCYSTDRDFRITGLYLVAGQIATVTVPQSVVDHGMFRIQVGANDVDTSIKDQVKRVDRITSTYEVNSVTTTIANPFGGTIYILVPNPCALGTIDITIGGGVVETPKFEFTSTHITTVAEWEESRTKSAPWFDLITDNYHMAGPSIWVNGYSHAHMLALAEDYSDAFSGVNAYLGYPQDKRNKVVLYESVDLQIRQGAYAPGNPQVNNEVSADANGPQSSPVPGQSNSWLVTTAVDAISMHEMSHCQFMTMYGGESEAIVNVAHGYVKNNKFGVDLDTSFIDSWIAGNFNLDDAMTSWLITQNFREGKPMDISDSELNQVRYQRRGYGKYFSIAKLHGWNVLSDLNLQENNEQEAGTKDYETPPHSPTETDDDRTYRMSLQANDDLRPLVHVWGVHPKDLPATTAQMDAAGLSPSATVLAEMQRYKNLIPKTQTEFMAHFDRVWPGMRDVPLCSVNPSVTCCASELYGCGWYNKHYPLWTEALADQTEAALNDIITTYWGDQPTPPPTTAEPTPAPTPAPTPFPTPAPTPFPTSAPTLPLCTNSKSVNWCEGRCPNNNCQHYCSCEAPNPTPSTTCSCEDGGPGPATPVPTPPVTPEPTSATTPQSTPQPTSATTPQATPQPTSQATPKPTAPSPPASCIAKNEPCSSSAPCCGSCNTKNGRCNGNGRLLRGRNDSGDQEDRSLRLFDNVRFRQPVSTIESRPEPEKKMVGKLQVLFDAEGNVNGMNRRQLHKTLNDNRGKWEKNKHDAYSFTTYQVLGESFSEHIHPINVIVVDGQPTSFTYSQTGNPVPDDARSNIPTSIDDMLDRIHEEIDGNVASFEVEYDEKGFPKKFFETKILPKGKTELISTYVSNVKAL